MPLHPFVVHLPIALSLLMPLLAAFALLAWWRGWMPGRKLWVAVVALQAVLLAASFAALRTGEAEEERVEAFVAESSLEQHEAAAQRVVVAAGVVLLLAGAALLLRAPAPARGVAVLALLGMAAVTALALQAGKAGGELVYEQGAAAAYAGKAGTAGATAPADRGEASNAAADEDD